MRLGQGRLPEMSLFRPGDGFEKGWGALNVKIIGIDFLDFDGFFDGDADVHEKRAAFLFSACLR